MSQPHWIAVLGLLLMAPWAVAQSNPDNAGSSSPSAPLQPLAAFADIADDTQRARALFTEIGKVIQHPRCVNFHLTDSKEPAVKEATPLYEEHAKMFAPLGVFRGLNDEQLAAVAQRGNWDRVGLPTIGIAAHGITRLAQS